MWQKGADYQAGDRSGSVGSGTADDGRLLLNMTVAINLESEGKIRKWTPNLEVINPSELAAFDMQADVGGEEQAALQLSVNCPPRQELQSQRAR